MNKSKLFITGLMVVYLTACHNTGSDRSLSKEHWLKEQLAEYFEAVLNGDRLKVSSYLYPAF